MCSRYWADESPEIREVVEEMNGSPLVSKWQKTTGITVYGEIRPTNLHMTVERFVSVEDTEDERFIRK